MNTDIKKINNLQKYWKYKVWESVECSLSKGTEINKNYSAPLDCTIILE